MNTNTYNLSAAATELIATLADLAFQQSAAADKPFVFEGTLTAQQKGLMTSLKKKGLIISELVATEAGRTLSISFTEAGRALVVTTAPQEEAATEEAPEVAPAEEAETEESAAPEAEAPQEEEAAPEAAETEEAAAPAEEVAPKAATTRTGVIAMFAPLPAAGTVLKKTYKGQTFEATLNADGSVVVNGTFYTSLTQAALTITGYKNISGRKFFGCAAKKPASTEA